MLVIIGGGITGLSLAYFLSLKGYDVTVVEKESKLGGNASWTNIGDFTVDSFYHAITNRDSYLLDLIQELGIKDKLFPVKLKMGFYQGGKLYSISTLKEFLFFPPLTFIERIQLGVSLVRSKITKDWRGLDAITAREWLSRLSNPSIYKGLWQPVMSSKFGPVTDEIVATDMWFRINRITGIRNKKFKESAYYIKCGLKTFFDTLEGKLIERGVRILKGVAVTKIKSIKNHLEAILLSNQEELSCDKVISTVSLPDFIKLFPDNSKEYAESLKLIKYLNNVCLILRLKEQFSPYYQLNLGEDGFPFTGIIGADTLYPPDDFQGSYILYISKYFLGENDFFDMNEQSLLEYYIPYLKKIVPRFEKNWILDTALIKKSNVEAIHTLHYSKLIPSFETPVSNLYLLCTAQIYPEPTVLDASVKYAHLLVNKFFK